MSVLLWESGTCDVGRPDEATAEFPHRPGGVLRAAINRDYKWKNGQTLKIGFFRQGQTGEGLTEERFEFLTKKVKEIAPEWCKYANLNFEFINDEERIKECQIRIQFGKHGHMSYIGTTSQAIYHGQASMTLGFDLDIQFPEEEYQKVILHEFGHAIAFIHEHQSPNLPKEIEWDKEAIIEYYHGNEELANSQFLKKNDEVSIDASAYDPESIMHYPIYKGWVKSMPDHVLVQSSTLSETDKSHVQKMYPGREF